MNPLKIQKIQEEFEPRQRQRDDNGGERGGGRGGRGGRGNGRGEGRGGRGGGRGIERSSSAADASNQQRKPMSGLASSGEDSEYSYGYDGSNDGYNGSKKYRNSGADDDDGGNGRYRRHYDQSYGNSILVALFIYLI